MRSVGADNGGPRSSVRRLLAKVPGPPWLSRPRTRPAGPSAAWKRDRSTPALVALAPTRRAACYKTPIIAAISDRTAGGAGERVGEAAATPALHFVTPALGRSDHESRRCNYCGALAQADSVRTVRSKLHASTKPAHSASRGRTAESARASSFTRRPGPTGASSFASSRICPAGVSAKL